MRNNIEDCGLRSNLNDCDNDERLHAIYFIKDDA